MDNIAGWVWVLIPLVAMIGGFAVAIVGSMQNARIRELRIRERIAMIEKGLVPPPEVDPAGFDRAMRRYEDVRRGYEAAHPYPRGVGRHRRAGIVMIGVGLGLMVLIGSIGAPDEGIGIGGFLCVLGLAFLINSFFERRQLPTLPPTGPTSTEPTAGAPGPGPVPPGPASP